eukprot:361074-Chlamydomonas_euryale.AAC.8
MCDVGTRPWWMAVGAAGGAQAACKGQGFGKLCKDAWHLELAWVHRQHAKDKASGSFAGTHLELATRRQPKPRQRPLETRPTAAPRARRAQGFQTPQPRPHATPLPPMPRGPRQQRVPRTAIADCQPAPSWRVVRGRARPGTFPASGRVSAATTTTTAAAAAAAATSSIVAAGITTTTTAAATTGGAEAMTKAAAATKVETTVAATPRAEGTKQQEQQLLLLRRSSCDFNRAAPALTEQLLHRTSGGTNRLIANALGVSARSARTCSRICSPLSLPSPSA